MLKKSLTVFFIAIFGLGGSSYGQECEWTLATITAESGLILRKSPGKGFVSSIPMGDTIAYCSNQSFGSLSYEGIDGFWRKVQYQGQEGYSFDGFIKPLGTGSDSLHSSAQDIMAKSDSLLKAKGGKKPIAPNPHPFFKGKDFQFLIETYNYCGDVSKIDLSLYWYGVFMDDEAKPTGNLAIRPVDLKIILSKEKVSKGMEFDLLTDQEERSLFLIGSDKVILHKEIQLEDVLKGIRLRGKRLFPGQELILNDSDQLRLSATGQITKAGPCPEAKNYQLKIKASRGAKVIEQDLASLISDYGQCSIPELYWYGDLSGDKYPELIFVSVGENANVFYLLQSNPGNSELFSLNSVFSLENCHSDEH